MNDDASKGFLLPFGAGGPADFCVKCRHAIDDHGRDGCQRGVMNGQARSCRCDLMVAS